MDNAHNADSLNKAVGGFVEDDIAGPGEVFLAVTNTDSASMVEVSVPQRVAYESTDDSNENGNENGNDDADEASPQQMLLKVPTFDSPAFAVPGPLEDATVAIVTTAALHVEGEAFESKDSSYRVIDRAERDLILGHWSPNFDRSGFALDLNVIYPIDRLEELAESRVIGHVAPKHISFAGIQPDGLATIRYDSGPAAAKELRDSGVDVVVLTPV